MLYYSGSKIPQDYPQALGLFTTACNAGHGSACAVLGAMYLRGQSVPRDFARSASLSQKACAGGDQGGCINLNTVKQQLGGLPPRTSASGTPAPPLPHTGACDPNCFYGAQCDVFQNTPSDENCCVPIAASVLGADHATQCRGRSAAATPGSVSGKPAPAATSRCGTSQRWCGGSSAGTCCAGYQTCCQRRGGNFFCGSGTNPCGR
jgi:TPR repeat protein